MPTNPPTSRFAPQVGYTSDTPPLWGGGHTHRRSPRPDVAVALGGLLSLFCRRSHPDGVSSLRSALEGDTNPTAEAASRKLREPMGQLDRDYLLFAPTRAVSKHERPGLRPDSFLCGGKEQPARACLPSATALSQQRSFLLSLMMTGQNRTRPPLQSVIARNLLVFLSIEHAPASVSPAANKKIKSTSAI